MPSRVLKLLFGAQTKKSIGVEVDGKSVLDPKGDRFVCMT